MTSRSTAPSLASASSRTTEKKFASGRTRTSRSGNALAVDVSWCCLFFFFLRFQASDLASVSQIPSRLPRPTNLSTRSTERRIAVDIASQACTSRTSSTSTTLAFSRTAAPTSAARCQSSLSQRRFIACAAMSLFLKRTSWMGAASYHTMGILWIVQASTAGEAPGHGAALAVGVVPQNGSRRMLIPCLQKASNRTYTTILGCRRIPRAGWEDTRKIGRKSRRKSMRIVRVLVVLGVPASRRVAPWNADSLVQVRFFGLAEERRAGSCAKQL